MINLRSEDLLLLELWGENECTVSVKMAYRRSVIAEDFFVATSCFSFNFPRRVRAEKIFSKQCLSLF